MIQIYFEKLIVLQEHHNAHIYHNHNVVNCYWMIHFSEATTSANMETTPVHEEAVTKHSHLSTNKDITRVTKEEPQRTWSGLFKGVFIVRQKSMQSCFICVVSAQVHTTRTELYVIKWPVSNGTRISSWFHHYTICVKP